MTLPGLRMITLAGAAVLAVPHVALAQSAPSGSAMESASDRGGSQAGRVEVTPYIQAAQVLSAELKPGNDTVTWTQLAAGVDASITGRNSAAGVSVRYERRIGYGDVSDSDTVSGIARGSFAVIPGNLTFEAGALATRTNVDGDGSAALGSFNTTGNTGQIYSVYAGPSFQFGEGAVAVQGGYQIGYSRVESPDAVVIAPGATPVDVFDDSLTHQAALRVGTAPHSGLPVGVAVEGGWNEQNVSNLDQRIRDRHVRGEVSVPVDIDLAVVGGIGYEDVEVSSRDAVRDTNGDPVVGADGRFVTDKSAPRQIAYQTDGLIWDVGALWRPSKRTSLSVTVGRRYGSMTYYGSLNYQPSANSNMSLSVYDSVTSFGGVLVNNLSGLPTTFDAFRNPISGDLTPCVGSQDGGNCALGGLSSVRSAAFRNRGAAASWTHSTGRTGYGFAAGFDRRKYLGAAGTVLASIDGVVDESVWGAAYLSHKLDARSSVTANGYVSWFDSGLANSDAAIGYSASLSYYRNLLGGLSGTAAVGLDGITRESLPDYQSASALVGLRYSF